MGRHKAGFSMGSLDGIGFFPVLVVMIFVAVLALIYFGPTFGFSDAMRNNFSALVAPLVVAMGAIFIIIVMRNPLFLTIAFWALGLAVTYLMRKMYELDVINDAFFIPIGVDNAQLLLVILFFVMGAVVGAFFSKGNR